MVGKIALAVATALAVGSTIALAQLPLPLPLPGTGGGGTPEERAACEPDAKRFCKQFMPDENRVLFCLQDNRKRISKACLGVLERYGQ